MVYSKGKGYINIKTYSTVVISQESKEILHKFNLSFHENGLMVYWSYGKLKGEVAWTYDTEKRLQETNPTDIWSLIGVLS